MVTVQFHPSFRGNFSKIKDAQLREKILKQIAKIKNHPDIGKPMRHDRKGSRELYIQPYRLSYLYLREESLVKIIALYHKDEQ